MSSFVGVPSQREEDVVLAIVTLGMTQGVSETANSKPSVLTPSTVEVRCKLPSGGGERVNDSLGLRHFVAIAWERVCVHAAQCGRMVQTL